MVRLRMWARSSLPFIFFGVFVGFFLSGQFLPMCPGLPHPKQSPFLIISSRCSVVNISTSIASVSFLCGWKFHLRLGSSFFLSLFFPRSSFPGLLCPRIRCILRKLLSNREAHSYHSLRVVGGFSNERRRRCKGI